MKQQHEGADNVGGNFGSLFKCSLNTPSQMRYCLNRSRVSFMRLTTFVLTLLLFSKEHRLTVLSLNITYYLWDDIKLYSLF